MDKFITKLLIYTKKTCNNLKEFKTKIFFFEQYFLITTIILKIINFTTRQSKPIFKTTYSRFVHIRSKNSLGRHINEKKLLRFQIKRICTKAGFPKVGHDRYSGGHEQQMGIRGAKNSKGAIGDLQGHNFLKLQRIFSSCR